MVQQQPGDRILGGILSGQVDGRKVGEALFALGPSMPHEGPPGMPRFMARALFPGGFLQPAAVQPPAVQPPVVQPPVPVQPPANQVRPTAQPLPARPAPRKRVLERGTFPEWH